MLHEAAHPADELRRVEVSLGPLFAEIPVRVGVVSVPVRAPTLLTKLGVHIRRKPGPRSLRIGGEGGRLDLPSATTVTRVHFGDPFPLTTPRLSYIHALDRLFRVAVLVSAEATGEDHDSQSADVSRFQAHHNRLVPPLGGTHRTDPRTALIVGHSLRTIVAHSANTRVRAEAAWAA